MWTCGQFGIPKTVSKNPPSHSAHYCYWMHGFKSTHWAYADCLQPESFRQIQLFFVVFCSVAVNSQLSHLQVVKGKIYLLFLLFPAEQPIILWTFRQPIIRKTSSAPTNKRKKKPQTTQTHWITLVPEGNQRRKQQLKHFFFRVEGGIKMGCKNVQLEMHNSCANARLVVQIKLQSPAFKTAVLYAAQTTQ